MLEDAIKKVSSGELKPREGRPWVLFLSAHGANKNTNVNKKYKLKDFLREEVEELASKGKLQWLDCDVNGKEAGSGWAEYHGCYIVYIWPKSN